MNATNDEVFKYDDRESFRAYVDRSNAEHPVEIDEEMFYYFLEVLPPAYMGREVVLPNGNKVRASFGFAEGAEPITAFWKKSGRYFSCLTKEWA